MISPTELNTLFSAVAAHAAVTSLSSTIILAILTGFFAAPAPFTAPFSSKTTRYNSRYPAPFGALPFSLPSQSFLHFFFFLLVGTCIPSASAVPWSPDLCVKPTSIGGSSGGVPFTILGQAGSSVSTLRVYRNNGAEGYLRGLVAVFSDGVEMIAGVRKDQYSELTLDEGELITGMTLWALTPSRGGGGRGRKAKSSAAATPRVARLDITTNRRSWGYGVDSTAKLSNKAVNVASGVLVGFQGRAGDDLDQLAPVFLKTLSESVVDNVVFERIPGDDGLVLETLKEGTAVWNGTDYSYTFSGSTTRDASTTFSSSTSNSLSLKTSFRASLPQLLESGLDAGWDYGTTQTRQQSTTRSAQLSWSSTVDMSAGTPAVFCSAMVWRGQIALRWSGTQTVSAGDASVSFPTSGLLNHVDYGKVETVCRPMAVPRSFSFASSSGDNTTARRWVA
ncbi:hypothetical protein VTH82DRAFT_4665 [Thermothelomyces myriococcoides]